MSSGDVFEAALDTNRTEVGGTTLLNFTEKPHSDNVGELCFVPSIPPTTSLMGGMSGLWRSPRAAARRAAHAAAAVRRRRGLAVSLLQLTALKTVKA